MLYFGNNANQQAKLRNVKELEKFLLSDIEKNAIIRTQFEQIFYLEYSLKHRDLKNNRAQHCACQLNR